MKRSKMFSHCYRRVATKFAYSGKCFGSKYANIRTSGNWNRFILRLESCHLIIFFELNLLCLLHLFQQNITFTLFTEKVERAARESQTYLWFLTIISIKCVCRHTHVVFIWYLLYAGFSLRLFLALFSVNNKIDLDLVRCGSCCCCNYRVVAIVVFAFCYCFRAYLYYLAIVATFCIFRRFGLLQYALANNLSIHQIWPECSFSFF